jgi:hypothetical protein
MISRSMVWGGFFALNSKRQGEGGTLAFAVYILHYSAEKCNAFSLEIS